MALPHQTSEARRGRLLALVAAAAGAVSYANTLWNGLVYDDRFQILENPWIPDLGNLGKVFTTNVWAFEGRPSAYYRPVMLLSYMLTYRVSGLDAWGYHLVNVLLHAAVSALVFALAAALLRRGGLGGDEAAVPALAGALLFATHPVLTESVAWAACVPELSYSGLFLASLLLYHRAAGRGGSALAGSVAAFFAALLCKEPAIMLPAVLVVHDLAFPPAADRPMARLRRLAPYAVAAGLYLLLRHAALPTVGTLRSHQELTVWQGLVNGVALFARYLAMLLVPVGLNAYHLHPPVVSLATPAGALALLATALFAGSALLAWRRFRPALLGLALIAFPLLPVLYAPLLAGENTFTERYLYLPTAGLALLASFGLAALRRRRPAWAGPALALVAVVVGIFALATVRRNLVWRSDETLWTVTAAQSPHSAVAHDELGVALMRDGRVAEARAQFQEALRLAPAMSLAHFNLALTLEAERRHDEALVEYRRAVEGGQPFAEAWSNLGEAYARRGELEQAVRCGLEAIRLKPDAVNARLNLGRAYDQLGRPEEAMAQYQAAVATRPGDPEGHLALGIAHGMRGELGRAVAELQAAARLGPADPVIRRNLAQALRLTGRTQEADEELRRAVALEAAASR